MIKKILSYISKSFGFLLVGFAVLMVVSAFLVQAMADKSGQLRDNIASSIEDFLGSNDAEEFIRSTQLYNDLSKFDSGQLAMVCNQQPELCEGVPIGSRSAMEISKARLRDNLADTQASGIETIFSQIKSYGQYKPMLQSSGIVLLIIGMVFVFLATFNVLELFSSTLKYIAVNLFLMAIGIKPETVELNTDILHSSAPDLFVIFSKEIINKKFNQLSSIELERIFAFYLVYLRGQRGGILKLFEKRKPIDEIRRFS